MACESDQWILTYQLSRSHTEVQTTTLSFFTYLLNINYGRNGLWMKRTMAEPECERNVSKVFRHREAVFDPLAIFFELHPIYCSCWSYITYLFL
jgi:hypothetical protein